MSCFFGWITKTKTPRCRLLCGAHWEPSRLPSLLSCTSNSHQQPWNQLHLIRQVSLCATVMIAHQDVHLQDAHPVMSSLTLNASMAAAPSLPRITTAMAMRETLTTHPDLDTSVRTNLTNLAPWKPPKITPIMESKQNPIFNTFNKLFGNLWLMKMDYVTCRK